MLNTPRVFAGLITLSLFACGKSPMPEQYINAADARAKAVCACQEGDPSAGVECVKKAKAEHVEPEGRPGKQDVTDGSWAAYDGFGDVALKCEMGVNAAYNAAKDGG